MDADRGIIDASRAVWDTNAEAWDRKVEGGGMWQTTFIGPRVEEMLAVRPGEKLLDVACGNGAFSRRVAELGATVVASDFSPELIRRAKALPREGIEYHVADATNEEALRKLGDPASFDAAVCNMALMDMPAVAPLYRAVFALLKGGGRFVFSVMHPAFNGQAITMLAERPDYALATVYGIKVNKYLSEAMTRGKAISEQPEPHYYWHRPLHSLLNPAFEAGWMIDRLEEPRMTYGSPPPGAFDWANYDMPPILFVRLRKP